MNTEVIDRPAIEPTTALTLPQRAAVALKTSEHEIKLRELLTNSSRIVAPANKAARDECHAAYMVLKNTRCSITNLSEAVTEDAKSFTKAVKTEAARLLAITEAEESRLQGLRDAFDEQIAAEKAAKIAAERARMEAIKARIEVIRQIPFGLRGKTAVEIEKEFDQLRSLSIGDDFEEFKENAAQEVRNSVDLLSGMLQERKTADAEAARLESERAELAKLRAEQAERERLAKIESNRIAAEQAAERQRLADLAAAQELAAKQLRDKAEANLKAERDAQAEQMRIERERVSTEQAKAAAEIRAQQDKLAEQQAAADARDAAALAAQQDAQRRDDDHGPALEMNAMFDAAIVACAKFPEVLAEQMAEEAKINADLARCTETAQAMLTNGRSLVHPESYSERDAMIDAADGMDHEPTDIEIIDVYVENFGGTRAQAVARLLAFVGDEA